MLAQLCIQRECPDQGITQTGYPDEGPRTIPAYGLGRIQVVKASASAGGPSKVNKTIPVLLPGQAHTLSATEGRIIELGIMRMRVLAAGDDTTGGAFTLFDCTGGAGAWTQPPARVG